MNSIQADQPLKVAKVPSNQVSKRQEVSVLRTLLEHLYQGDWLSLARDWELWRRGTGLTVVFTPNPEQVVQAQQSPAFLTVLHSAEVLLPDGEGLIWAAKRLLPQGAWQRFAGREVVEWWLSEASQRRIPTLLLGSKPGVAEKLAREVDPHHEWCAAHHGYAKVQEPTDEEEATVLEWIETYKPEILFVAFGAPWQEMWVSEHRDWLEQQGVKIVMVCGGALDLLSPATSLKKPPRWLERGKLEWLYRLIQEPSRWRRQLRLFQFIWMVYQEPKIT